MGTKIKGKYAGNCKICGSDWRVGEEIFYQKDPKAIVLIRNVLKNRVESLHLTLDRKH